MNDEKLKNQLGANIAAYRKQNGYTQATLAEKLNYSDKAVSKWERGESLPDLLTLMQLSELFGVTLDDLTRDNNALPEDIGKVEQAMGRAVEKTLKRKADKRIIQQLCAILVWFVALLTFVVCATFDIPKSWIAFFYAVPITAIVLLVLRSAWHDFRRNPGLISMIMWGTILSIYMTLLLFTPINFWMLFLLGIPGQLAIILWARLFRRVPVETENG